MSVPVCVCVSVCEFALLALFASVKYNSNGRKRVSVSFGLLNDSEGNKKNYIPKIRIQISAL